MITKEMHVFILRLLSPVVLHHQDLHHADKDIEEVKLQADALRDRILLYETPLGKAGVVQDLLNVVEREAAKDCETTVEPEVLGEGKRPNGSHGDDERSQPRDGNNGSTGQEGSTNVEVLFLLGGGADKRDGAHHGDGVEASTGNERARNEGEKRSDESGLRRVEGRPKGVLGYVAVEISC